MKITKEVVVPNYGLEGTQGPDGKPAIYTTVTNQNIVLNAPYQGLPSDYSKANGNIQVFEGDKEVTQQATYTLKQTLNTAATLDGNKFKVTHVSTDNGMFIVTVSYKEFVSDIMITTNVVRNGQSGPKGDTGQDGKDGVGVKSTVIRYAINTQGDTPPSTGWVSQVPTLVKGQFLWTETTWTYTDSTSEKGYSVTYISKDGNNGEDGIAGKDGVGIKNTTFKYGISTSGTTKPSNWSTTIPTVPEGQFLWTETMWTYTDNTSEKGYSVAKQGAKGPQGDKGQDGQDGPPTGIIESPTIPTEVYQGMLWKNTGNLSGFITDVTYIYRGSKWEKYIFTADNIYADNLAAITANLGEVTGGSFIGGKFINNFVDIPLLYNGTSKATGQTKIENGQITIAGKIDNTFNFVTKYTVDAISSTIYYPNSGAVMKMFSITPDGFLLADHQNGFSGQLLASSLTKTPWVNLNIKSGYSVVADKPLQYNVKYNLDGTRTISFRGQVVKLSSGNIVNMEANSFNVVADLPQNITPNVESNGYGVTDSGNGCRVWAATSSVLGARIGTVKTGYVDFSSLNYIID